MSQVVQSRDKEILDKINSIQNSVNLFQDKLNILKEMCDKPQWKSCKLCKYENGCGSHNNNPRSNPCKGWESKSKDDTILLNKIRYK